MANWSGRQLFHITIMTIKYITEQHYIGLYSEKETSPSLGRTAVRKHALTRMRDTQQLHKQLLKWCQSLTSEPPPQIAFLVLQDCGGGGRYFKNPLHHSYQCLLGWVEVQPNPRLMYYILFKTS